MSDFVMSQDQILSSKDYKRKSRSKMTKEQIAIQNRKDSLSRYGLTLEQYDKMFEDQDGVCKICKEPPEDGENLHVDHDHNCCPTRKTCGRCNRGLLCNLCNRGLGMFRDKPELLVAAAHYLNTMGDD